MFGTLFCTIVQNKVRGIFHFFKKIAKGANFTENFARAHACMWLRVRVCARASVCELACARIHALVLRECGCLCVRGSERARERASECAE